MNGIDVITEDGQVLVEYIIRFAMVPYMMTQRRLAYQERISKQREGIEAAKQHGKYTGRKEIRIGISLF